MSEQVQATGDGSRIDQARRRRRRSDPRSGALSIELVDSDIRTMRLVRRWGLGLSWALRLVLDPDTGVAGQTFRRERGA